MRSIWLALGLLVCAQLPFPAPASKAYDVVHHPTSTRSAAAQECFDRGLTLFYAYARLASRRAFECAAKADANFAMAYWGIALADGSNINVTVDPAGERAALAAIQRAQQLGAQAPPVEQAYIGALATRYAAGSPDLHKLAVSYERSMAALCSRYPDDPDAATLHAEALMELQPWQLYAPVDGAPLGRTDEIVAILSNVLVREPGHIGANHFYIHAIEASRHPERALPSASRLQSMHFEPAASHLEHMPAHIYMRTGDFSLAAQINEHASMHDVEYLKAAGEPDPEFTVAYHDHNLNMLSAAYGDEGNWSGARRTAAKLTSEGAFVPAMFVFVRFGRWQEILALKQPKPDSAEPLRLAIWHFARGVAYASTGRVKDAQAELAAVRSAQHALHIAAWPGTWNSSNDLLSIAIDTLEARIAIAQQNDPGAIAALSNAVAAQDRLLYIEPPDWYAPMREALGGALYAQGAYARSAEVFRADLVRNPRNPRSLFGLWKALGALGDQADAAWVQRQFQGAWQHADIELRMSAL